MNTDKRRHEGTKARRHEGNDEELVSLPSCLRASVPSCLIFLCSSVALFSFSGCSQPSTANITLRKEIDQLRTQIEDLNRRHEADQATIAGLKSGATTVPSLPEDRIAQLFTTHGLRFGRLTGGADLDPNKPGDDGLKIYVVPTDDDGQALKAAGSFEIDAFDLAQSDDTHLGHWAFDVAQTRQAWYGLASLYTYVFKCPWQKAPEHEALTIRVKFTDALTGRVFTAQREVQIKKPQPASS